MTPPTSPALWQVNVMEDVMKYKTKHETHQLFYKMEQLLILTFGLEPRYFHHFESFHEKLYLSSIPVVF